MQEKELKWLEEIMNYKSPYSKNPLDDYDEDDEDEDDDF